MKIDNQKYDKLFNKYRSNNKYKNISDSQLGEIVTKTLARIDRMNKENDRITELKRKEKKDTLTPKEAEELQYYYHGEKIDSFLNDEDNSDDFLALEDYEHTSWYDLAPEGLGFNEYGESEIDWDEY